MVYASRRVLYQEGTRILTTPRARSRCSRLGRPPRGGKQHPIALDRIQWKGEQSFRMLSYYCSIRWNVDAAGAYVRRWLGDFTVPDDPEELGEIWAPGLPPLYSIVRRRPRRLQPLVRRGHHAELSRPGIRIGPARLARPFPGNPDHRGFPAHPRRIRLHPRPRGGPPPSAIGVRKDDPGDRPGAGRVPVSVRRGGGGGPGLPQAVSLRSRFDSQGWACLGLP